MMVRETCPEVSSSPTAPAAGPFATNDVSSSSFVTPPSSSSPSSGELYTTRKISNGTAASNGPQIQKVLATTRIQQEIEEQTQREMALRAAGSIKTISHERTDIKVVPTKLSGVPPVDHNKSSCLVNGYKHVDKVDDE